MNDNENTPTGTASRLQEIKDRQGLLRARNKNHNWRNILAEADLNYKSTMVQFTTKFISDQKLEAIETELDRREAVEFD